MTKPSTRAVNLAIRNNSTLTAIRQRTIMNEHIISEKERRQMITEILARQGLTQQDLAFRFGCSFKTVNSWVNGRSTPEMTPQEAVDMCQLLNCTIQDLAKMFPGHSKRRAAISAAARESQGLYQIDPDKT